MGTGTYVGLALDVGGAGLEIKEACVTGREAQCRREKYVEAGRLVGSVAGAAVGGKQGAKLAIRGCRIFLGIAMKGSGELACAIIGGAAGGQTVGNALGHEGALLGGKIQETNGGVIFVPEGA